MNGKEAGIYFETSQHHMLTAIRGEFNLDESDASLSKFIKGKMEELH